MSDVLYRFRVSTFHSHVEVMARNHREACIEAVNSKVFHTLGQVMNAKNLDKTDPHVHFLTRHILIASNVFEGCGPENAE